MASRRCVLVAMLTISGLIVSLTFDFGPRNLLSLRLSQMHFGELGEIPNDMKYRVQELLVQKTGKNRKRDASST